MSLLLTAVLGATLALFGAGQQEGTPAAPPPPGDATRTPPTPVDTAQTQTPGADPEQSAGTAETTDAATTEAEGAAADAAATEAAPSDEAGTQAAAPKGALADADPARQRLVSGAPLYNPNVAVHIVQKKQFVDGGKHELTLYPAVAQVNGKFTQHYGTALSYTYHLHENLGLQITPQYNWSASESAFNLELVNKVRQQGQPATTLLLNWVATGGVEVTPLYGKFAFYQGILGQFSLVLTGGAGIGQTQHMLKPPPNGVTYGDTGRRFVGQVGAGLRVQLGNRFTLRLEVRDLVYTARVDQVNGCNRTDLEAMFERYQGQLPLEGVDVSGSCDLRAFQGTDDVVGDRIHNVPWARQLVLEPSSDVLNLVSFYTGFSVLF